jgi:predicted kinase
LISTFQAPWFGAHWILSCILAGVILNAAVCPTPARNLLRIISFGRSTLTAFARESPKGRLLSVVPALPLTLPATPSLCYKPSMRKWMSERLKRRKKAPEKQPAEAAQAPLQPKYFDAQESGAAAEAEPHDPEQSAPESIEPPPTQESPADPSPRAQTQPQVGGEDASRGRRRRRGRGGRGRGRQGGQASTWPRPDEASPPQPETGGRAAAVALPRAVPAGVPKGVMVLAIGLPGSGKSAWFKRHSINPLSSDLLRTLLFDDPTEQRFQDLVFSNLRSMLKARLIARRPLNYVDATNLTPQERQNWIKLAHDYGYEAHAVFFDVPVEVCLERNQRRERMVPEDVMRRMAAKLRPPTFEEGFTKITAVKVKKKEGEPAPG